MAAAKGPNFRRLNMGQLFIVLGVISAVLTIFVIKSMMSAPTPKVVEKEEKGKSLVVAMEHIHAGEIITSNDIKAVKWPEKYYPTGGDVYSSKTELVGRAAKQDIFPGQPLHRLSLAGEKSMGGLPLVIPEGHRAVTIRVNDVKGVAGFVKPGDHVDVLTTLDFKVRIIGDDDETVSVTETILQDALVLAIAQEMYDEIGPVKKGFLSGRSSSKDEKSSDKSDKENGKEKKDLPKSEAKVVSSVTLALPPVDVERLVNASRGGVLALSLRPEEEHSKIALAGVFHGDLVSDYETFERVKDFIQGRFTRAPEQGASFVTEPTAPDPLPAVVEFEKETRVELIKGTFAEDVIF